jgi:hypothetical protein
MSPNGMHHFVMGSLLNYICLAKAVYSITDHNSPQ